MCVCVRVCVSVCGGVVNSRLDNDGNSWVYVIHVVALEKAVEISCLYMCSFH